MGTEILLPWWAWAYLIFVSSMFILSFFADEKTSLVDISSSVFSLFSIWAFIISYFHLPLYMFFGLFFIPMVMIGSLSEFMHSLKETERAQDELDGETDLSDGERRFLLNFAVAFNAILVVPGYLVGFLLCVRLLSSAF